MSDAVSTKKVSIIIPCYNVAEYIAECMDSIIRQSYPVSEIEVIAIDDCSTDDTLMILKEYEGNYSDSIMLIPLETHVGLPGMLRNIAMDYSSGKYVVFLDSDDILAPDFLKRMLETIESENCDVVSCGYILFNSVEILAEDKLETLTYDLSNATERKKLICNEGTRTSVWARIYRREFLIANNIRFSDLYHIAEDMFFWHQCMFYAKRSASIMDSLYKYRIKEDSLFHASSNNYAMDVVDCAEELCSLFFNNKELVDCSEAYEAVIWNKCGEEVLGYLDTHVTSDELFTRVIVKLRRTLKEYCSGLLSNRYLSDESKELVKKLW